MKRLKGFSDFVNEEADLLGVARSLIKDVLSAKSKEELKALGKVTPDGKPIVTIGGDNTTQTQQTKIENYKPPTITTVPGNDDFTLYMQHQQGVAGAKGLIQAMQGTGKLHPDTIATKYIKRKGKNVRYANLAENVPSDKPQVFKDMIAALDAGDQKTAASLFLNMWKEKWDRKSKQAQIEINSPKNALVKNLIGKYSQKWGIPFEFAATVAYIESGFNPKSGNGSYNGIYALSQKEFSKYAQGNIFDPEKNIDAGIQCLKNNIKSFKTYLGPTYATLKLGDWVKSLV